MKRRIHEQWVQFMLNVLSPTADREEVERLKAAYWIGASDATGLLIGAVRTSDLLAFNEVETEITQYLDETVHKMEDDLERLKAGSPAPPTYLPRWRLPS